VTAHEEAGDEAPDNDDDTEANNYSHAQLRGVTQRDGGAVGDDFGETLTHLR
jgi:hypothetical protein